MSPSGDALCSCSPDGSHLRADVDNRQCSLCYRSETWSSASEWDVKDAESLVGLDLFGVRDSEKLWRILIASVKAFSIGAGLKGGLALVSVLSGLRRRRKASSVK